MLSIVEYYSCSIRQEHCDSLQNKQITEVSIWFMYDYFTYLSVLSLTRQKLPVLCRKRWKMFYKCSLNDDNKICLSIRSPNINPYTNLTWLIFTMVYKTEENTEGKI